MKSLEKEYREVIKEILIHQTNLLGKKIAYSKANKIIGLEVDKNGHINLTRDSFEVLQDFVHEYSKLSALVFKYQLGPILQRHPDVAISIF